MNTENASALESNGLILKRIEELQNKVGTINKNRKTSAILSVIGIILVIVAILVFFNNLNNFVKYYDANALMSELQTSSSNLASSEEMKELVNTLKKDLMPAYELSLTTKLRESAPLFQADFNGIKENLSTYLTQVIKPQIENNLVTKLSGTETMALAENFSSPESKAKIDKIVALTKSQLLEKMPGFIDTRIDPVLVQLNTLNNSFSSVYDNMIQSGEFDGVTPQMTGEIENRLIENILEMMIYQLNPQKANKLAN
ncbi:MAG: hypothetical protein WCR55_00735 [Lentisphaerota bacterium]